MICKHQAARIKDFLNKLHTVDPILDKVIAVTGAIRKLPENATVEEIDALIPDDTELQGYFNLALNAITGTAAVIGTAAGKIKAWIDGKTELQVNADLFKLASVATAMGHKAVTGEDHPESFYDLAVQGTVYGINPNHQVTL